MPLVTFFSVLELPEKNRKGVATTPPLVRRGLNMRIRWRHTIWGVFVPITTHIPSFINVAHTELWIYDFLLLANQNRYTNEVLNMRIRWRQTTWWVVLVPITTHIPSFIKVVHTKLWIFDFFVISQSEQICKCGIKYVHLVPTGHMGSTSAHHYPHTKFHQCSPYRTLHIWLFLLLANQNRYANEVLNMRIWWRQTTWVVLVPPTIPTYQVWRKSVIAFLLES